MRSNSHNSPRPPLILRGGVNILDSRGNEDFQSIPAFWDSDLLKPVLDETSRGNGNASPPVWPEDKPFAACLTHDVDHVSLHSFGEHGRRLRDAVNAGGMRAKFSYLKKNLLGLGSTAARALRRRDDPFWTFEKWIELESRYNAKSTFFFFADAPSHYHPKDCRYRFRDKIRWRGSMVKVSELMRELESLGWDIGLHGSYHSFDDAAELTKQKLQLEKVLKNPIVCNRQHILHFDAGRTPFVIEQAGFKYDSSPGFNRIVGFRFGTAFPFSYRNPDDQKELSLIHIPLHIQDSSLFRRDNMDLNGEGAFFYCKLLIDRVKDVGGVITLSWHHGTHDDVSYPGWFSVYVRCLEYLKEQNAWMASMKEIGDRYSCRII